MIAAKNWEKIREGRCYLGLRSRLEWMERGMYEMVNHSSDNDELGRSVRGNHGERL